MMSDSELSLALSQLLKDFQDARIGEDPFSDLKHAEDDIAVLAAKNPFWKVNPANEKKWIFHIRDFSITRTQHIFLRFNGLYSDLQTGYECWGHDFEGNYSPRVHTLDKVEECLKYSIVQDAILHNKFISCLVLSASEIKQRYNLTGKQIRDWSKDERRPFIQSYHDKRKYVLDPNHPELRSLERSDIK